MPFSQEVERIRQYMLERVDSDQDWTLQFSLHEDLCKLIRANIPKLRKKIPVSSQWLDELNAKNLIDLDDYQYHKMGTKSDGDLISSVMNRLTRFTNEGYLQFCDILVTESEQGHLVKQYLYPKDLPLPPQREPLDKVESEDTETTLGASHKSTTSLAELQTQTAQGHSKQGPAEAQHQLLQQSAPIKGTEEDKSEIDDTLTAEAGLHKPASSYTNPLPQHTQQLPTQPSQQPLQQELLQALNTPSPVAELLVNLLKTNQDLEDKLSKSHLSAGSQSYPYEETVHTENLRSQDASIPVGIVSPQGQMAVRTEPKYEGSTEPSTSQAQPRHKPLPHQHLQEQTPKQATTSELDLSASVKNMGISRKEWPPKSIQMPIFEWEVDGGSSISFLTNGLIAVGGRYPAEICLYSWTTDIGKPLHVMKCKNEVSNLVYHPGKNCLMASFDTGRIFHLNPSDLSCIKEVTLDKAVMRCQGLCVLENGLVALGVEVTFGTRKKRWVIDIRKPDERMTFVKRIELDKHHRVPSRLAQLPADSIAVAADQHPRRLQIYNTQEHKDNLLWSSNDLSPYNICADKRGYLWISEANEDFLKVLYTTTRQVVAQYDMPHPMAIDVTDNHLAVVHFEDGTRKLRIYDLSRIQ